MKAYRVLTYNGARDLIPDQQKLKPAPSAKEALLDASYSPVGLVMDAVPNVRVEMFERSSANAYAAIIEWWFSDVVILIGSTSLLLAWLADWANLLDKLRAVCRGTDGNKEELS